MEAGIWMNGTNDEFQANSVETLPSQRYLVTEIENPFREILGTEGKRAGKTSKKVDCCALQIQILFMHLVPCPNCYDNAKIFHKYTRMNILDSISDLTLPAKSGKLYVQYKGP